MHIYKQGLAEGGKQAHSVFVLRISSKWTHKCAGKKKISMAFLTSRLAQLSLDPQRALLFDLEGLELIYFPKEASTKPGTQQTLRDCLLNKRMDGRMGGWLDMITGSCR